MFQYGLKIKTKLIFLGSVFLLINNIEFISCEFFTLLWPVEYVSFI